MTASAWPYGWLSTRWRFSFLTTSFSFAITDSETVLMKKPSLSDSAQRTFSSASTGMTWK